MARMARMAMTTSTGPWCHEPPAKCHRRAACSLGEHRRLQPVEEARPVLAADQDDREAGHLAGGDEGERLEELVHRAVAAGQDDEGLRVLRENRLADEEVAELDAHVHVLVEARL